MIDDLDNWGLKMQPHKCGTNAGTNQYILPKIASQINKDCYGSGRESTSIYLENHWQKNFIAIELRKSICRDKFSAKTFEMVLPTSDRKPYLSL